MNQETEMNKDILEMNTPIYKVGETSAKNPYGYTDIENFQERMKTRFRMTKAEMEEFGKGQREKAFNSRFGIE